MPVDNLLCGLWWTVWWCIPVRMFDKEAWLSEAREAARRYADHRRLIDAMEAESADLLAAMVEAYAWPVGEPEPDRFDEYGVQHIGDRAYGASTSTTPSNTNPAGPPRPGPTTSARSPAEPTGSKPTPAGSSSNPAPAPSSGTPAPDKSSTSTAQAATTPATENSGGSLCHADCMTQLVARMRQESQSVRQDPADLAEAQAVLEEMRVRRAPVSTAPRPAGGSRPTP